MRRKLYFIIAAVELVYTLTMFVAVLGILIYCLSSGDGLHIPKWMPLIIVCGLALSLVLDVVASIILGGDIEKRKRKNKK